MTNNSNKILLVDDEINHLNALKRVLSPAGYKVFTVTNPNDALEVIVTENIPLAIIDQRMPEMDGDKLCAIIAEESPKTIRFLVSGFSDFKLIASALTDGTINRFFQKPVDNLSIIDAISQAFNYYQLLKNLDSFEPDRTHVDLVTMLPNKLALENIVSQAKEHNSDNICLFSIALNLNDQSELISDLGKIGVDDLIKQAVTKLKETLPPGYFLSSPSYGCFVLSTLKYKENLSSELEVFDEVYEVVNSPYDKHGMPVTLNFTSKIYPSQKEFGDFLSN